MTKAAVKRLPAIALTHATNGNGPDVASAVAAIAQARRLTAPEDDRGNAAPDGAHMPSTVGPTGTGTGSAPTAAAKPAASAAPASPASTPKPPVRDPNAPVVKRITGKKYNNVKVDAARSMLEDRDLKITELEERLRHAAPVAAAVTDDGFNRGIAELTGLVFGLTALATDIDEVALTKDEKAELREQAPAIRPYVPDVVARAGGAVAFGATVLQITAAKIKLIREVRALRREEAERADRERERAAAAPRAAATAPATAPVAAPGAAPAVASAPSPAAPDVTRLPPSVQ